MNFLLVAVASLLAVGDVSTVGPRVEPKSSDFALRRDGIETPLGKVSWDDVVRVRYFQRAAQKNYTGRLSSRIRIFSEDHVVLECFEGETRAYVPVEVRYDGTWLRVSVEAGDIVEPLACNTRVTALEFLPGLLDRKNSSEGSYLLPLWGGAEVKLGQKDRVTSVDRLYTYQAEWEKMGMVNAFGLSTPAGSMLGIIDGGEFRAQVETSFDPAADVASQVAVVGVRVQNQSRAAPRRSHLSHTTAFVGIEKSWTAFVVTASTTNSPTAMGVSLVPVAPSPSVSGSMEAGPSPIC